MTVLPGFVVVTGWRSRLVLVTLLRASRVSGKHSGFLVDGKAASFDYSGVLCRQLRIGFFESTGIKATGSN